MYRLFFQVPHCLYSVLSSAFLNQEHIWPGHREEIRSANQYMHKTEFSSLIFFFHNVKEHQCAAPSCTSLLIFL